TGLELALNHTHGVEGAFGLVAGCLREGGHQLLEGVLDRAGAKHSQVGRAALRGGECERERGQDRERKASSDVTLTHIALNHGISSRLALRPINWIVNSIVNSIVTQAGRQGKG